MRGGHFVYALYQQSEGMLRLPNAAYMTMEEAEEELKIAERQSPEITKWAITTIWVAYEKENEL
jgi:hypothetical protein